MRNSHKQNWQHAAAVKNMMMKSEELVGTRAKGERRLPVIAGS